MSLKNKLTKMAASSKYTNRVRYLLDTYFKKEVHNPNDLKKTINH